MGWGPLDRLHDVVTGIGGAAQAPVGLVWDLGRAPFVDDDVDGILGTLNATITSRTGQLFGNIFGPEEGLGAIVGGTPGREHLRGPVQGVMRGLETGYREGVGEPLSTALTAASLAESDIWQNNQGKNNWGALFDMDTWRAADSIAEHRSPGQAAVLVFATKDILDQEEVERFQGTDAYRFVSGTLDAFLRAYYSPDVIVGKSLTAYRAGSVGAARGGELARISETAAPQIGGRAERLGQLADRASGGRVRLADRITSVNNAIDRAYERMPKSAQALLGSERDFGPRDISRLDRLETTRRQLRTEELSEEAARAANQTVPRVIRREGDRATILENIVESRRVREARVASGANAPAPAFTRRLAEQLEIDVDAYFAGPNPKGFTGRLFKTRGWEAINQYLDDLATEFPDVDTQAGFIHDRLFPNHHRGDVLSRYLAEANNPAERQAVMRVALGDMRGIKGLLESNYGMGKRLEDLMMEQATIRSEPVFRPLGERFMDRMVDVVDPEGTSPLFDDYRNAKDRMARIGEEMDGVVSEQKRNQRLLTAAKSLPAGPMYSRGTEMRNAWKSSSLYQESVFGKAVRVISDMRPHNMVYAEDPNAPAQLSRMLREVGYDDTAIAQARGQFNVLDPQSRGTAFETWVERAERKILKEHGLDEDEIREILNQAHLGKSQAKAFIRESKFDAEKRARVRFHDGDEMVEVELPLSVTQLQNIVPVPNFNLLRKHAARYSRLKYGDNWRELITSGELSGVLKGGRMVVTKGAQPAWTMKEYGLDAMRGIMEVWRPAVLLRPAWTLRVVGDEQMRMLAKFGTLSMLLGARDNINNYMTLLRDESPIFQRVFREDSTTRMARRASMTAAGTIMAGPGGGFLAGTLGNKLVKGIQGMEEAGYTNLRFGGHSLSGPFGDAGSVAEFYKTLNSAAGDVDALFGKHENRWYSSLRRDPTRYRSYTWGDSAETDFVYRSEWARNLRHQISQDEMGRRFLVGQDIEQVLDWLDNTVAGRRYASLVPWRKDHRAWVEAYADQIESYTGGVDDVKKGVLAASDKEGEVEKLLDLIPEENRAPIHGAETDQMMARSPLNQLINAFVDNTFEVLGTMATDTLSRNPTFQRFYETEARRLFSTVSPGSMPEELISTFEDQARGFALRETRDLLYDLAEQSRFASMTRLLMPFYQAWQEVLTRWAGLAIENPVFASRAKEVWQAPDRMGWTYTDDRGNTFLKLRIPEFAKGIVNQGAFAGSLDSQGHIFLDKKGLNLVAQGTPGFGPFVQIGVSEMVRQNPSLEQATRFVIPFGPTDGFVDSLLPPTVKRALATSESSEGAARANAQARILVTKLTQMENGDIPQVDFQDPIARKAFLDGVDEETTAFMNLRLFTGFVAPVAPLYESPYKPYIDIYRALRDNDYERAKAIGEQFDVEGAENLPMKPVEGDRTITADDIFLETFGPEFFALTQAFTESLNGVPPTVEGLEVSEKYGGLIAKYPEWGGVIAGYDGGTAAQFSRAVYDRQMNRGERRRLTKDEILDGPEIRLGWAEYSKFMDLIDMVRVGRGLPNLQVKGAEDLSNLKRVAIAALSSKYPAWFNEFSITDRNTWSRRIEGARALTENEALSSRPDIQGIADYLNVRDAMMAVLATRESHSLRAAGNQDLAMIWQSMTASLVERNPEFAEIWYRKLENDPLELEGVTIQPSSSARRGGGVGGAPTL